jgi:hypothetical protein
MSAMWFHDFNPSDWAQAIAEVRGTLVQLASSQDGKAFITPGELRNAIRAIDFVAPHQVGWDWSSPR